MKEEKEVMMGTMFCQYETPHGYFGHEDIMLKQLVISPMKPYRNI